MIHMDHVFEVKTGCPAKEYPELQQLFARTTGHPYTDFDYMWLEWIDLVHLWQDLGAKLCHRDYRSCCELKTLCQSLHARTQVFEDYYHLKFHGSFKGMFHLQQQQT